MTTYTDAVLADSPLHFWTMDTLDGENMGSFSTPLVGTDVALVPGIDGNAWDFNGTSARATVSNFPFTIDKLTISVWMKSPSTGWTMDYPTFVRRNGTDVLIVRGRLSSAGYEPGVAEAHVAGVSVFSSVRVDDGEWHHVVLTLDKTNMVLYVDGVVSGTATTGKSGYTFGTGSFAVGDGGAANELMQGSLDSLSIYNKVLSPSRIATLYSLGTAVNTEVDVDSNTMSFSSKDVSIEAPTVFNASVGTLTFTSHDPLVNNKFYARPVDDTHANSGSAGYNYSNSTTLLATKGGAYLHVDTPPSFTDAQISGASLTLNRVSGYVSSAENARVRNVSASWNALTLNHSNKPAPGTIFDDGLISSISSKFTYNISSIVNAWTTGTINNYGLVVTANTPDATQTTFSSMESTAESNRPLIEYTYVVSQPVDFLADAGQMTLSSNDLIVSFGSVVDVTSTTLSMVSQDVTVETVVDPNVSIDLDSTGVSFTSLDVVVEQRVETVLDAVGFDLTAFEPSSVETTEGVDFGAQTGVYVFRALRPAEVQGEPVDETEDEDRLFSHVRDTRTGGRSPELWLRGNTTYSNAGSTYIPNRAYNFQNPSAQQGARVAGTVVVGQPNGPSGRKTMEFLGNGYLEVEPHIPEQSMFGQKAQTLMFGIRTTKSNQYIMGGGDELASNLPQFPVTWGLRDGKIAQFVDYPGADARDGLQFKGYTDLADGNWHFIVISGRNDGSPQNGSIEIWIDGKFELSRRSGVSAGSGTGGTATNDFPTWGAPDWVGGFAGMSSTDMFVGELSEILFYVDKFYAGDSGNWFRDAFMDVMPVRPETPRVTFSNAQADVEDNAKRVLWIYMPNIYKSGNQPGRLLDQPFEPSFMGSIGDGSLNNSYDVGYMKHFFINGINWVDERTEGFRLIDLENDIDTDFFDVINVIGWPTDSASRDFFYQSAEYEFPAGAGVGGRARVERFLEQFKNLIVAGKSTVITSPHFASDLGFIGDFTEVPVRGEMADRYTLVPAELRPRIQRHFESDIHSGLINPFGTPMYDRRPNTTLEEHKAASGVNFRDTHVNNWQVVRNLVPGITDIPGNIVTDFMYYMEPDTYGTSYESYKYGRRPEGLSVGDKFWFEDSYLWHGQGPDGWADGSHNDWARTRSTWGIEEVKAGTVITTFADNYWRGGELEVNPYRNHAMTVAITPGQALPDGRQIAGKVFIDVGDSPFNYSMHGYSMPVDQVPSNEWQIANLPAHSQHLENAEQREWDYTKFRSDGSTFNIGGKTKYEFQNGVWVASQGESMNIRILGRWWPVSYEGNFESMMSRGWKWISEDQDADGNALVGVNNGVMNFMANELQEVYTERGTEVMVNAGRINFNANNDEDTAASEATILAFAPSVEFRANPWQEIVEVPKVNVVFTAHDIEGTEIDEAEVIGLSVYGVSREENLINIRRNK